MSGISPLTTASPDERMAWTMAETRLLGLIGSDISLSRTPRLHEVEGLAQGHPTVYRRLDTALPGLADVTLSELLVSAVNLGFDGLNITHPHKQAVVELLDAVDDRARALGSVNTVVIRDGETTGYNTDVSGFARGLATGLPDADLSEVVQIGAGGAGAAVAHALAEAGVGRLILADMDSARAGSLAESVNLAAGREVCTAVPARGVEEFIAYAGGVVNCTPLGMAAHPGTPFDTTCLTPDHWVGDVVYMPVETELLRAARKTGCAVLDGTRMAVFQAVDAFELFTGKPADAERMRGTFLALS